MFKVGALVECINDSGFPREKFGWIKFPVEGEIYVVRSNYMYEPNDSPAILLEELKNPPIMPLTVFGELKFVEPHFYNWRFKLLQEELSLTELFEEEAVMQMG